LCKGSNIGVALSKIAYRGCVGIISQRTSVLEASQLKLDWVGGQNSTSQVVWRVGSAKARLCSKPQKWSFNIHFEFPGPHPLHNVIALAALAARSNGLEVRN
jgi:hypothetical protein